MPQPIISRHRLLRRYRFSLMALWLTPPLLLLLTPLLAQRWDAALLDLRLWAMLLLMGLPALYIWQEGVDVHAEGITARIFWPRFYPYTRLDNWYYDARADRRVITVWSAQDQKLLECRAAHLTQPRGLIDALHQHVRNRRYPR
jgi:hypothetical protein